MNTVNQPTEAQKQAERNLSRTTDLGLRLPGKRPTRHRAPQPTKSAP